MSEALQRTETWHQERMGIPTASNFDKIYTGTGLPSKQATTYMNEILAHMALGYDPDYQSTGGAMASEWVQRGVDMEIEAALWYEGKTGEDIEHVGFVINEAGNAGCSPDGLLGCDGGLEIKCPKHSTHIGYWLNHKLPVKYVPQVQGSLWITGRLWWDFVSYHPEIKPMLIRVERNEKYIEGLASAVNVFCSKLAARKTDLVARKLLK